MVLISTVITGVWSQRLPSGDKHHQTPLPTFLELRLLLETAARYDVILLVHGESGKMIPSNMHHLPTVNTSTEGWWLAVVELLQQNRLNSGNQKKYYFG